MSLFSSYFIIGHRWLHKRDEFFKLHYYTITAPRLLQLLNVRYYSLLERAYEGEIESLVCNYTNYITKLAFLPAYKAAVYQAFTDTTSRLLRN
jgi:hypothetical protein